MPTETRIITIVVRGPNDYDVHEGERFSGRLVWDEMLGQIATLTHPDTKARYSMLTPDEMQARADEHDMRMARIRAAGQAS